MLRIKNWDKLFENNRTREMVKMQWVPVPNRHDGEGYSTLMSHSDGLAFYGAWQLILQTASKCLDRGVLSRDDGTALDAHAIAVKTRAPESILRKAIPVLIEIGWLELFGENPAGGCGIPAGIPQEGARNRIEGREENRRNRRESFKAMEMPPILETGPFIRAWADWVDYKAETKFPLTPSTAKAQIKMLIAHNSPLKAQRCIEVAIASGWRAPFAPKNYSEADCEEFRREEMMIADGWATPEKAAKRRELRKNPPPMLDFKGQSNGTHHDQSCVAAGGCDSGGGDQAKA